MDPPLDLEALNFRSNNSLNEGSEWYFFQSFSAPFLAAFRFFSRSISCVFHAWIISSRKIGSELYLRQNTCAPSLPIREKKPASTGDYFNWRFKPPPGVRVSFPITFNRWRARPLFCSGVDGNR